MPYSYYVSVCSHALVLARVVRKVDNPIHWKNQYAVDGVVCFLNTYLLDRIHLVHKRYPFFEQLEPKLHWLDPTTISLLFFWLNHYVTDESNESTNSML